MDAEIKKAWIEALRSGRYKQGMHQLRTVENEFCCWGVLCDIVDPEGWNLALDGCVTHRTKPAFPSDSVIMKAGLINDGKPDDETITMLANKNDWGESFDTIANWIENNL
jgi:hypothetical protein